MIYWGWENNRHLHRRNYAGWLLKKKDAQTQAKSEQAVFGGLSSRLRSIVMQSIGQVALTGKGYQRPKRLIDNAVQLRTSAVESCDTP